MKEKPGKDVSFTLKDVEFLLATTENEVGALVSIYVIVPTPGEYKKLIDGIKQFCIFCSNQLRRGFTLEKLMCDANFLDEYTDSDPKGEMIINGEYQTIALSPYHAIFETLRWLGYGSNVTDLNFERQRRILLQKTEDS